jgi:phytoene dehydrogenase-like protein
MAKGKTIVIGGGVAGLATAIRLRAKGWEISLFEASEKVGGKMGELQEAGYRWDSGPSLFTMPQFLDELFDLCGKQMADYIPYKKKEVVCNYFWDDGETFSMPADPKMASWALAEKFNEPFESL